MHVLCVSYLYARTHTRTHTNTTPDLLRQNQN